VSDAQERQPVRGFQAELLLYRKIARQLRPYWLFIAGLFGLSLMSVPLRLLAPLPLKIAVDHVVGTEPFPRWLDTFLLGVFQPTDIGVLAFAAALLVGVAVLTQLQELVTSWLRTYVGEKVVVGFRTQLFGHAHRLSLTYHDIKGTADATYRIQNDAGSIQSIAVDGIIPLMTSLLSLGSMIYVTTRLSWRLAAVALAITPVLFLISHAYRHRMRRGWKEVKKFETLALSVVHEVLGALRVVKAFGQEDREEQRFARRSADSMQARLDVALAERRFAFFIGVTTATGTALVLFVGTGQVNSGILTLGELLLVMSYLSQLYEPLKTISRRTASMQGYLASVERAFALLEEPHDVLERPHARPLRQARGGIGFRDVAFGYDDDRTVLEHLTFDVKPGQRVGIVGATGAGKTTIVSLLARFYDPTAGQIVLDGSDLRDYKLADLRKQFSIVLQEPVLFSTSIGENIAYARPGASLQEITAAAQAASIHDFIATLPHGYDTVVGERGLRLSGGERQRVSLARAFLRDAPILILDEPTSSVDVKTEASIMEVLERLLAGRTTIVITHRPSLLKGCDVLFRVHNKTVSTLPSVAGMAEVATFPAHVAGGAKY
jgi:ATP-binding cassette, subfamily B, bacterial